MGPEGRKLFRLWGKSNGHHPRDKKRFFSNGRGGPEEKEGEITLKSAREKALFYFRLRELITHISKCVGEKHGTF